MLIFISCLKNFKQNYLIFFLFVFLLFPSKYIYVEFLIDFTLLFSLIVVNHINLDRRILLIFLVTLSFIVLQLLFRYLIVGFKYFDFRDFIEYARIIILFLGISVFIKINLSQKLFVKIIRIYVFLDFIVSLGQFFNYFPSFINFITNFYANEVQIEDSLVLSSRTLGLFPNPSAHGIFILILTSILIADYFWSRNKSIFSSLVFILISLFIIVITQSQTALIGLFWLIILTLISNILYKSSVNSKAQNYFWFIIVPIVFVVFFNYVDQLKYLVTLFEFGLGRNSYVERVNKTSMLFNLSLDNPLGFFTGFGKNYFGDYSKNMDNEILYILLVWGLPFFILFSVFICFILITYFKRKNFKKLIYLLPILVGIPIAWPSSYYLDLKNMLILIIAYSTWYSNHRNYDYRIIGRCK